MTFATFCRRLATDLALWEPAAPSVSSPDPAQRPTDPLTLLTEGYQMCKSATQYGTFTAGPLVLMAARCASRSCGWV